MVYFCKTCGSDENIVTIDTCNENCCDIFCDKCKDKAEIEDIY